MRRLLILFTLLFVLSACGNPVAPLPTPPPASVPARDATPLPDATPPPTATAQPTVSATPSPSTAPPTVTPPPAFDLRIDAPTPGSVVRYADVLRVNGRGLPPASRLVYRIYEERGAQIGAGPMQPVDAATMVAPLEFNSGLGSVGQVAVAAIGASGELLAEAQVQVELARTRPADLPSIAVEAPGIVIEAPLPGAALNGSFELRGSSSIMPFEGSLTYRIYDAAGTRIAEGPLQAGGDYSGPAQFAAVLDVPAISGAGHIEVVEINAMDGSLFAAAVVEVQFGDTAGIVLAMPPAGTAIAMGTVVRGSIDSLPDDARLQYRLYDVQGIEIGAGTLEREDATSFAGTLDIVPVTGVVRLAIVATDRAGRHELATRSVTLRGTRPIGGDFQTLESGAVPQLRLEAPASGTAIGPSFELRGSISATPHDALLSYRIYNAAGTRIAVGPVYVPGVPGQPAGFVEPINLGDIADLQGSVRLELVETNPPAGRARTGVSVELVMIQ
jgi:hypothetical protein